jgi:hypothetical protein
MGKVYDLEKEKQKAKDRAKDLSPPIMCLTSKDGNFRVYPKMERGPDGEWRIKEPEAVKAILGYDRKEADKEEEPKAD